MELQNLSRHFFFADSYRRAALAKIIYQQQIIIAFQKLRENKIEPILIKGWSIEQFYPLSKQRKTADIDLSVSPEDYQKSKAVIELLGFSPGVIDLHKALRRFDKLPWTDLFGNSRLVELQNAQIRVLRPEDNLRVTCIHWLNDGGADKEKLWDIYYQVANRHVNFDWNRCLESNGRKRRKWLLCALAITHRYLDLPINDLPFADEIETILPCWMIPALEKEWNDNVKIARLEKFLLAGDWKSLRQQLKKRLKPNPIGASIDLEASFDNSSRVPYQIADIIFRFTLHFGRNTKAVLKFLQIISGKGYD